MNEAFSESRPKSEAMNGAFIPPSGVHMRGDHTFERKCDIKKEKKKENKEGRKEGGQCFFQTAHENPIHSHASELV